MLNFRKVVGVLLLIYLALITFMVVNNIKDNAGLVQDGTSVLSDFWNVQFGEASEPLTLSLVRFILFTAVPAYLSIYVHNNHAFYSVQQRIGYTGFLRLSVVKIFKSVALLSICSMLYQLGLILIMVKPFPSNIRIPEKVNAGLGPFDDNTWLSIATFILLSAIGWGVFAVFIFAIGLFVQKNSIFIVLGTVIALALIVGPALIIPAVEGNLFLAYISTLITPASIIAPGQMTLAVFNGKDPDVFLVFAITTLLYAVATAWTLRLWLKRSAAQVR